ncbi:MAG: glycosyltransferase family 2 protein [Burkholderiaceae bacterium]|jgi:glycosyltransferase involved in cell wall biosynthesis|nr:glycosyltransferase family 2 protein [Burkholderiaceae bacterium]
MAPPETACAITSLPAVCDETLGPRHSLSCIIPCRNEASNLALLLPQVQAVLDASALQWEVILVDDGSTDDTHSLLKQWTARPGFRALQLSRNFGKEAALTAGFEAARGDAVLSMDADLQHTPELIPTLIKHWHAGADVVYAVRANRDDESAFKRLGTRWFYRTVNASGRFNVPPDGGDFRLMSRAAVDALLKLPERNRFMKGLYAWIGFNAVAVPYVPKTRAHGQTHFNALRLLHLSIDGVTAFATWPLRAVSVVGLLLALAGFIYGGYLTLSYLLWGNAVSGWTTIVILLLLFMGVQMISLGILGEYVGRIFEEVKNRPIYIVRHELGHGLAQRRERDPQS